MQKADPQEIRIKQIARDLTTAKAALERAYKMWHEIEDYEEATGADLTPEQAKRVAESRPEAGAVRELAETVARLIG